MNGPVPLTSHVVRYGVRLDPADRYSPLVPAGPADPGGPAEMPAAFPQRPGLLDALHGSPTAGLALREDAHLARISAPVGGRGLPVLLFIPGGGWVSGTGLASWYDDPALAVQGRAVVVTVNHRLGIAGHFGPDGTLEEGQQALADLVCALRWVHAHIAEYGGDPANITLAGDSAGAWHAYALSALPAVAGLVARTLLVSMPGTAPLREPEYLARRSHVVDALARRDRTLRTASADDLIDAQRSLAGPFGGMALRATAAGEFLPDLADHVRSARRLTGDSVLALATSEESAAFLRGRHPESFTAADNEALIDSGFTDPGAVRDWLGETRPGADEYERAVALASLNFQLPALGVVTGAAAAGLPSYLLRWEVRSRQPRSFAPHCFPLPFLFGNRAAWRDAPMLAGLPDDLYAARSAELVELVAGFLYDGRPVLAGEPLASCDPISPRQLRLGESGPAWGRPSELGLVRAAQQDPA